jgi:hypothetical protein
MTKEVKIGTLKGDKDWAICCIGINCPNWDVSAVTNPPFCFNKWKN